MISFNKIGHFLSSKDGNLRLRIFRGGIWLSLGAAITNLLGIIKLSVLGRFLTPGDFGLLGIALVSLRWVEAFTETGFNAAIIHKKGDVHEYLHTIWVVQLVRGFFISSVLLASGKWIAIIFFDRPDAGIIIQAVSIIIFLRSWVNPAVQILKKNLDLRAEFLWRATGAIAGFSVGVILAITLKNVWALVGSIVAAQVAVTITSYIVFPFKPKIQFSLNKAKELRRYGKSIFFSNIFVFFRENSDSLLIAKFCGIDPLGYYQMARQFSYDPASQAGLLVRGVMFPAYSSMHENSAIQQAFLKTIMWVIGVVIPLGYLCSVFPEDFVQFFMGTNWKSLAPTFAFLIWGAVFIIINGVTFSCLAGIGKPNLAAYANGLNFIGLLLFLAPPLRNLQEVGMAIIVTFTLTISTLLQIIMVLFTIKISFFSFIKTFKIVSLSLIPFVILSFTTNSLSSNSSLVLLLFSFLAYVLIILFFVKIELLPDNAAT